MPWINEDAQLPTPIIATFIFLTEIAPFWVFRQPLAREGQTAEL
jgi:hypothetical protein